MARVMFLRFRLGGIRFFDHVKHHWGERAKVVEIADGGHFWLDGRTMKCLLEEVEAFIEA